MSVKTDSLKEKLAVFQKTNTFKVGDLVVQKSGMDTKKGTDQENPGIVVEILSEQIISGQEKSTGNQFYREPLDIIIGEIATENDGEFVLYHFDSRRLEHFTE